MGNRFYERRKKEYFTIDSENSTSKEIIFKLLTPCERLFLEDGRDFKSKSIQHFLTEVRESTNDFVSDKHDINFFLRDKRRPYLFELIRHNKQDLIKDKNFTSIFVNELEEIINELGFNYGTRFTEMDIKKIALISIYMLEEDANIKLSLEDDDIYHETSRKHKR